MATRKYDSETIKYIESHSGVQIEAILESEKDRECKIREFEKDLSDAYREKLNDKQLSVEDFRTICKDYGDILEKQREYALKNKRIDTFRLVILFSVSLMKDIGIIVLPMLPTIIKIYIDKQKD